MKRNCKQQIKQSLGQKNNKEKGDKLYVKRQGYENSFNKKKYLIVIIKTK